jgi:cellulose synthase/poly-beta-1,6-N-acetylglucosamine synthase-like glycosyltransferase
MSVVDGIFYGLLFLGIFIQIFFFVTLIIDWKKIGFSFSLSDEELPEVTLLIPCWNEEKTIEQTIASIRKLNYPQEKIILMIIDDGSTDNTWQVLQKYAQDSSIVLLQKENGGKTSALNVALPQVKTKFMCSLDADTFLDKDALRTIVSFAYKNPHLEAVGGTVMIHKPRTWAQSAQSVDYQMFSFSKKMLGLLGGVLVAPGAFSLFKTDAVRTAGGYHDGHGLEDLELTYRMQKMGMSIDQCHTARAYTTGPATIRALFKQRLRWSYGFLNNTYDYKDVLFNKKYGIFGSFTVPMGVVSYFIILYMFLISWYFITRSLIDTIIQVNIQGIDSLWAGIDLFFFGTKPVALLSLVMYVFILLTVLLGRWLSGVKGRDYHRFIIFIILYSLLVPFWVLRSTANFLFARRPSWR